MKFKKLIVCEDETIVLTDALLNVLEYLGNNYNYYLPENISNAVEYLLTTIIVQEENWNATC